MHRHRLTNRRPFIEDPRQENFRLRIIERQVDWECFHYFAIRRKFSDNCAPFIGALLDPRPKYRMSMSSALKDAWIVGCGPIQDRTSSLDMNGLDIGSIKRQSREEVVDGVETRGRVVQEIQEKGTKDQPSLRRPRRVSKKTPQKVLGQLVLRRSPRLAKKAVHRA